MAKANGNAEFADRRSRSRLSAEANHSREPAFLPAIDYRFYILFTGPMVDLFYGDDQAVILILD